MIRGQRRTCWQPRRKRRHILLFALALIPVVILLVFIFQRDKNEKEPVGLLILLFFAGMTTAVPAFIAEVIGEKIIDLFFPYDSVVKAVIVASLLVGPAEELGKYIVLREITWKNKNFNYSYDAIVYAVFTSLGFAAIENIGYVFGGGIGTALVRMFTAVPGHACFAVFMGFFYSKAKYAEVTNNRKDRTKYTLLSLFVPILIHGVYDAIAMGSVAADDIILSGLGILTWFGFVIAMFLASVIVVVYASKHDFCFLPLPEQGWFYYRPNMVGSWKCACGSVNQLNFCQTCGRQRPMVNVWNCPRCGTIASLSFCGKCGYQNPYVS